jgi:CRP/FNR family transcriptional regulator, cyclic AMP receptor protein
MALNVLEFPLLKDLDDAERRSFLSACVPRRFARREIVFHEGDPGDCLHLVASGRFGVQLTTPAGDTATLRLVGAGEMFGELVLIHPGLRRSATVVALEPSCTLALGISPFAALRRRHPPIDRMLSTLLAANVRRMSELVTEALYLPVDRRLARRLDQLAGMYDGVIPLTQEDLARFAGTTRATANTVLRHLAGRGVLALARGRVTVLDRGALRRHAR